MPNGNLTTNEYLVKIDQKLEDFIKNNDKNREDHGKEHTLMWKLIIGLPSFLVVVFTLVITLIKIFSKKGVL